MNRINYFFFILPLKNQPLRCNASVSILRWSFFNCWSRVSICCCFSSNHCWRSLTHLMAKEGCIGAMYKEKYTHRCCQWPWVLCIYWLSVRAGQEKKFGLRSPSPARSKHHNHIPGEEKLKIKTVDLRDLSFNQPSSCYNAQLS